MLVFNRWINHDGTGCPVPDGYVVDIKGTWGGARTHSPTTYMVQETTNPYLGWDWSNYGKVSMVNANLIVGKITRYRIHKPKGAEMLEAILTNLPAEVTVNA